MYFIISKWNLLQIFIFELVQQTFYQYFYLACKYKDILHDYFPLKLIGKYLLLYNKHLYHLGMAYYQTQHVINIIYLRVMIACMMFHFPDIVLCIFISYFHSILIINNYAVISDVLSSFCFHINIISFFFFILVNQFFHILTL